MDIVQVARLHTKTQWDLSSLEAPSGNYNQAHSGPLRPTQAHSGPLRLSKVDLFVSVPNYYVGTTTSSCMSSTAYKHPPSSTMGVPTLLNVIVLISISSPMEYK